jgi:predicted Zn-dependent protease
MNRLWSLVARLSSGSVVGALVLTTGVTAITLISVEQEVEIGRQANAKAKKELPELRDAEVAAYVRSIAARLVRVAPGPKYPYTFSVVNYREINAFALPGGPVWLHRGVLHSATNESQVAGVLAHEIAHIAERHAASQLTKGAMANLGLGLLGAVLGNSGGAGAAQTAASFMTQGMFLKFSRDDEREADRVGLRMLTRAGWDARGMVELFDLLGRAANRDPGLVDSFFSSHPSPADRIKDLRADVATMKGGRRDTAQFRAIRSKLLRMAPPKAMPKA